MQHVVVNSESNQSLTDTESNADFQNSLSEWITFDKVSNKIHQLRMSMVSQQLDPFPERRWQHRLR